MLASLEGAFFMDTNTKISANRQKKIGIVADLNAKFAKSKAIIFTNYTGVTHKQLEALKRAIKPMDAEYVVAKNSLVLRALDENKIKLEGDNPLEGPTGTLLIYADVVAPLKQLAKTMKELGLLSVKLGIMENKLVTGEQVLKISTLPSRETLLAQIAAGLKSPISGLHRALHWNLQKFVMTLAAIAKSKPVVAAAPVAPAPVAEPKVEPATTVPTANPTEPESIMAETVAEKTAETAPVEPNQPIAEPNITEPETIAAETEAEVEEEKPETENPTIEAEMKSEGGEN
jgi:large subunit ribosomal protein L10